ncbi:hypothetical protein GYMLUDRAFT_877183 [Collybiopsis luxurians FD-317 M1]|nr:hypothetical protein GYMLUDRAFT_877183 [Collybiopsis luxurians FD-317 M1]
MFLMHMPSQKTYPIPGLQNREDCYVLIPGYILCMSSQLTLIPFPDPDTVSSGTPLRPTHHGSYRNSLGPHERQRPISKVHLVSTDISPLNNAGSAWLLAEYNYQKSHLLRVTLEPDGLLDFTILNDHRMNSIEDATEFGCLTTVPGFCAIGLTRMASLGGSTVVLIYSIDVTSERELYVDTACTIIPEFGHDIALYILDPFRGLVTLDRRGQVRVMDII